MDCSSPGSPVDGISQARVLEWAASPGALPDPRIKPRSPALHMNSLPSEPAGKPLGAIAKRKKKVFIQVWYYLE